jgi:branched-chain amino acid transport system substrate-binding protein
MSRLVTPRRIACRIGAVILVGALAAANAPASAQSSDPIRIGFSLALTGPLAPNGKQALLGAKIWEEEINAKGGLLGRKVELVNYDDQSNPANIPGIYTKLLDVDKVDLIMGPYGTNLVAPAIPVVMPKGKVMLGLFALEVNSHFHYPNYFSMVPYGPDPKVSSGEGFFAVAAEQNPKPQTVAIISEDTEFGHNGAESAEINAKKYGMQIIYNKTFPPGTTDFSPIIRAVAAANADIVNVTSYPLSSVGIVQTVNELGFKPKMIGGGMVGLQATVFKDKLKSKLNGFTNYETWVPSLKMLPRAQAFFTKYQERAKAEGVDPLGYYLGGWGYADFQVLAAGVEGAKSLDDAKIGDWLHHNEIHTVIGDISFGPEGEWTKPALFQVQYHDITDAANLETWRGMGYQTVVYPPDQKTGELIYPYAKAK